MGIRFWKQLDSGLSRFRLQNSPGSEKKKKKKPPVVGRRFKNVAWCPPLTGHLTLAVDGESCRLGRKPFETQQELLWYLCLPSAHGQQFSVAQVLTEKSLSSRILLMGGKEKEVASYKTQVRLVVAAVEGKWGFLTFLHWGARYKGAAELHAWFRQSWLPSPATFPSCVLFSLI